MLPLTPPLTPLAPSSPAGNLELLSELTDSTAAEVRQLEDNLIRLDAITSHAYCARSESSDPMFLEHADIGLIFSPLRGIEEPPLSPLRKRKASDLKVEGPLTPSTNLRSPEKKVKSVSFPEMLQEYIPGLPFTSESGNDLLGSQSSFGAFFSEQVAPLAEAVNKQLESEKLQEFDTTKRVHVPRMNFSLPQAPWIQFTRRAHDKNPGGKTDPDFQMKLLVEMKREVLRSFSAWHGVARLERELQWCPFPAQLGLVALDEQIQDDKFLYTLLDDLRVTGIVHSSSLTWKPEGLRILDDIDGSEDELDMAEFDEERDLRSSLKRRLMEIEDEYDSCVLHESRAELTPNPKEAGYFQVADGQTRTLGKRAASTDAPKNFREPENTLMLGSLFSASSSLSRFMEIHGKAVKKPQLTESSSKPASLPLNSKAILPVQLKERVGINAHLEKNPSTLWEAISLPPLPLNLPSCPFIISATLLTQRHLTQSIQKTYPEAELVERDFNLPHLLAEEADLILSPSTGLILTNIQRIKQSALPGQPERSLIKERITSLVDRYERLIVFVSEGLTAGSTREGPQSALDSRDSEAFASLVGFSMTLEGEVSIIYLPGGEKTLVRWIVCAMERWGVASSGLNDFGELKLLQDETLVSCDSFWPYFRVYIPSFTTCCQ